MMLPPIVFHMDWNTAVLPVKWTPAKSAFSRTGSPTYLPGPGIKLITPSGTPASFHNSIQK